MSSGDVARRMVEESLQAEMRQRQQLKPRASRLVSDENLIELYNNTYRLCTTVQILINQWHSCVLNGWADSSYRWNCDGFTQYNVLIIGFLFPFEMYATKTPLTEKQRYGLCHTLIIEHKRHRQQQDRCRNMTSKIKRQRMQNRDHIQAVSRCHRHTLQMMWLPRRKTCISIFVAGEFNAWTVGRCLLNKNVVSSVR